MLFATTITITILITTITTTIKIILQMKKIQIT